MRRIYAQAPEKGCEPYIKPGKRYEVARDGGAGFMLVYDGLVCEWSRCPHLNGGNWTRIEEGAEEATGRERVAEQVGAAIANRADLSDPKVATPDPRDTRIAELEAALERIDQQVSHALMGDWSIALNAIREIARATITGDKS